MTKKELSQLYWLNREIEQYKKRLKELEDLSTNDTTGEITGMPHGAGCSDKVGNCAAEMADLKALIELSIQKCWYELNRLNRYIESVGDSLIRQILTYRYVNGFTWNQVAANIGGGNTADGVRMLHNRFLEGEQTCSFCSEK
ncbi:MAG: RNA polymerase subunit sigma-24 [Christensenella sp.]|uniref:RNA polymerase subunit sigma-24 n=1 Tax=Christensenella sp. TaxID=1935934 RepID=UPI002B20FC52|nr:RNA polymerase subunit sigma-24 [Christensenella sp.]MEA5004710.1 RNA polymerase subunit sigma-24 [Christensenella sp.]